MIAFECAEHGVAVEAIPAYGTRPELVEKVAADHAHAEPMRWRIYRDADGWWVVKRADHLAFMFTWEQACLHVTMVTLVDEALDEWTLRSGPGRVSLQEHGDPLTHFFYDASGTPAASQALTFLRSLRADRDRRRELAAARDRARVELDVIADQLVREVSKVGVHS